MALVRKIWNSYNKSAIDSFLLLFPGALSAFLIFLIASNRLFPNNKDCGLFLLNLFQLQMLGITIVKFGIDQIIISRLKPGNRSIIDVFFKQRVFPLTVLFCIIIGFIKSWMYAVFFALVLPMEVLYILVSVELSISNRIKLSFILTLVGYPLTFILAYIAYTQNILSVNIIFACFFVTSFIKMVLSFVFRNKGPKEGIAILSYTIPLQQIGNYFMFRFDQLIIALGLSISFFSNKPLIMYYLFLAKFTEVATGVIVSLAPILYRKLGDQTEASLKKLFANKYFLLISCCICIDQILVSLFLFKPPNRNNDILLFLPFLLSSLLILPANLITYNLLKKAAVQKINRLNFISCFIGLCVFGLVLISNNIYIFSLIVPIQLLVYVILFQLLNYKNNLAIVKH
jgi:hypothetical protein